MLHRQFLLSVVVALEVRAATVSLCQLSRNSVTYDTRYTYMRA